METEAVTVIFSTETGAPTLAECLERLLSNVNPALPEESV